MATKVSAEDVKSALGGGTSKPKTAKKTTKKPRASTKEAAVGATEEKADGSLCLPDSARPERDWNKEVNKSALFSDDNGNQFIPLKELERIARLKGYSAFTCVLSNPSPTFAAATATVVWNDGSSETGCADAGPHNIEDPNFAQYPAAMAQARARARALRFGLNINLCSKEEIGSLSTSAAVDDDGPIQAHQIACIQAVSKRKSITVEQILSLGDSKVSSLSDLTIGQGRQIIAGLSDGTVEKLLKQ